MSKKNSRTSVMSEVIMKTVFEETVLNGSVGSNNGGLSPIGRDSGTFSK